MNAQMSMNGRQAGTVQDFQEYGEQSMSKTPTFTSTASADPTLSLVEKLEKRLMRL